ncbi:hypothetical protein [Sphingomicrobium marinum]|uniref:hypothetical protein n=1 Tax=Sphingomicrobium marinum TaxID=1227950 RepID=UPI00223FD234|nr:hypothetical protein [Sphingomicrobium marinum]
MSQTASDAYEVAILKMDVEGKDSDRFSRIVNHAVERFREVLKHENKLRVTIQTLDGPHLVPGAGAYSPLDFLELGFAEKTERNLPFLIAVTEVDLSAKGAAYTLAYTSPVTNVAITSTRRLEPSFWGDEADDDVVADRLSKLLLFAFGKLVNLATSTDPANAMHAVSDVDDLDASRTLREDQWETMRTQLPREAHDMRTSRNFAWFFAKQIARNVPEIGKAIANANPLTLMFKLPTMIAAALSVIVVLLFSAETWDVANAMTIGQAVLFSAVSIGAALFLLYRAFALEAVVSRQGYFTESMAVTMAATFLTLLLTILLLFAAFAFVMYVGVVSVFPPALMDNWPTTGEADSRLDHIKLSAFLAAMGVLAGSLGGRSDSKTIVRNVLFSNSSR